MIVAIVGIVGKMVEKSEAILNHNNIARRLC